jgi:hypothetical protein
MMKFTELLDHYLEAKQAAELAAECGGRSTTAEAKQACKVRLEAARDALDAAFAAKPAKE